MATVKNGFLGDAIGKLGNVVFRKWNSLITVSKYQPMVKNPNTLAQQLQRQKIKNLSLALQPFKDNVIPLNFKNRNGRSTAWAEAIKANYPMVDESGKIIFQNMILSGGSMLPPLIVKFEYNPFIDMFYIEFSTVNMGDIDFNRIRLTAVGRLIFDNSFNTSNICKLPFKNRFSTYINEMSFPDWPLNFDFDNAWSEGMLFYNIINDSSRDVRAYNPANIINSPSAGAYFNTDFKFDNFDFNVTDRIIMPENIHATTYQVATGWCLKISIDDYTKFPELNPDDVIHVIPWILVSNGKSYGGNYTFPASEQSVTIPINDEDQDKPFNILYFITDAMGKNKTTVTRFGLNHPDSLSYCELLFKNGLIHPDSIKIHAPFTAIWGDLKDFIPPDLIGTIPYTIHSKNETTGEERQHIISSDNIFLCSKLLRNQIYTITIKDEKTISAEFDVIGIDDDYTFSIDKKRPRKVVKFKAGSALAAKVK
ncbi:MAG: hypothetical protein PHR81_08485 [Bacteroidales bacterium]|nr:hypothetical protein [Bacteroidales bacterium]